MEEIFSPDLKAQPKAPVKLLEKDIQARCVSYARSRGYWARKFSSPGNRSVPDYIFGKEVSRGKFVKWAEEFKAPGKGSTDAQLEEQGLMRKAGWVVYTDTGTNGKDDVTAFIGRIQCLEETGGDAFSL
jgi:hypothetical protein